MKSCLSILLASCLLLSYAIPLKAQSHTHHRKKHLVPFDLCPGVSTAITRAGTDSTTDPDQVYLIDNAGTVCASGHPLAFRINAFGLNRRDGFLYGLHETDSGTDPFFTRVDKEGDHRDLGRLRPPDAPCGQIGIINIAAGTMDGRDNYYFMAIITDTPFNKTRIPQLFLGKIKHVSRLDEGDPIEIKYKEIKLGSCAGQVMAVLSNLKVGAFQDISFDPQTNNIYSTLPTHPKLPAPESIVRFNPSTRHPVLRRIQPDQPNPAMMDMCGLYSDQKGGLFILTTDGKFYKGDVHEGTICPVAQTTLPLMCNNLRGNMASCVSRDDDDRHGDGDDDDDDNDNDDGNDHDGDHDRDHGKHSGHEDGSLKIVPNPVPGDQLTISVDSKIETRAELRIFSPKGIPIQSRILNLSVGSTQVQVDVSRMEKGIYSVILVDSSGKTTVAKFIKL